MTKNGPRYLRWALIEATVHAARHPAYAARFERTRARLGKQRGPKVARTDVARRLAEAIWYMLTRNQPFNPHISSVRRVKRTPTCSFRQAPSPLWLPDSPL